MEKYFQVLEKRFLHGKFNEEKYMRLYNKLHQWHRQELTLREMRE